MRFGQDSLAKSLERSISTNAKLRGMPFKEPFTLFFNRLFLGVGSKKYPERVFTFSLPSTTVQTRLGYMHFLWHMIQGARTKRVHVYQRMFVHNCHTHPVAQSAAKLIFVWAI